MNRSGVFSLAALFNFQLAISSSLMGVTPRLNSFARLRRLRKNKYADKTITTVPTTDRTVLSVIIRVRSFALTPDESLIVLIKVVAGAMECAVSVADDEMLVLLGTKLVAREEATEVKRVELGNVVKVKYGREAIVEKAIGVVVEEVVGCVPVATEVVVPLMMGGERVNETPGSPVGRLGRFDGLLVPGPTREVPVGGFNPGSSSSPSSSSRSSDSTKKDQY